MEGTGNYETTSEIATAKTDKSSKKAAPFKIIVIGDSDVGKTCLTYRFCAGQFPENTEATIGVDFRERSVDIDGAMIKLQLWDTAGQERFRKSMVPHYYRNVHAVVFTYDITKLSSFQGLPTWIEECDRYSLDSSNVPRILVGNKCDLTDRLQVDTNLAQRFADAHSMPLFETSAKKDSENDNVEAIFLTLAHKLKSQKPMMKNNYPTMKRAAVLSVDKEIVRTPPSASCGC